MAEGPVSLRRLGLVRSESLSGRRCSDLCWLVLAALSERPEIKQYLSRPLRSPLRGRLRYLSPGITNMKNSSGILYALEPRWCASGVGRPHRETQGIEGMICSLLRYWLQYGDYVTNPRKPDPLYGVGIVTLIIVSPSI